VAYVLPRQPSELQRLDLQHHVLKSVTGVNWRAPIEQPERVLDFGCGTGQWSIELAEQLPDALVVGLDLVPSRSGPGNYAFVRGNVLQGLPFAEGRFDFVHQRLMVASIPVRQWPAIITDLVRVTTVGGWIELVEAGLAMNPEGPATARLIALLRQFFRSTGLDSLGHVLAGLDRYLRDAGLVDVQLRTIKLPIGNWAGPVGSWQAAGARSLFTHLAGLFESRYGLQPAECHELISEMMSEFERYRPTTDFKIAYGRRRS
jgi:SAM-dependent methyltransferase